MQIDRSYTSPNHSSRNGQAISMLVLHATVGSAKSALDWLSNRASQASTHYLIDKKGKIYQLVPDELAAWHAGKSFWKGLYSDAIQAASLGIELENKNDGKDPYPAEQIDALNALAREKIAQYRIHPDMIARHLDVAIPKGRKSDPAGFPWEAWKAGLFVPQPPPLNIPRYRIPRHPYFDRPGGVQLGYLSSDTEYGIKEIVNGWGKLSGGTWTPMAGLEKV
jgi:N-acetylmuramoyl-L-alanine amidase